MRQGFEPWIEVLGPYNGLANRRLQPLGHLTADGKYTRRRHLRDRNLIVLKATVFGNPPSPKCLGNRHVSGDHASTVLGTVAWSPSEWARIDAPGTARTPSRCSKVVRGVPEALAPNRAELRSSPPSFNCLPD